MPSLPLGTKQCGETEDFPPWKLHVCGLPMPMTGCHYHIPPPSPPLPLFSHSEPLAAKNKAREGLEGNENPTARRVKSAYKLEEMAAEAQECLSLGCLCPCSTSPGKVYNLRRGSISSLISDLLATEEFPSSD